MLLKNDGLSAKLIMQVHDELIINCPIEEKEQVSLILKTEMEKACELVVPLEISLESSYRWSDGH